jgi:RimJ/RimL family protein N-acetyltransferase
MIELRTWADEDLALLRRLNAPAMMEHLGGPESEEQLLRRHERYLTYATSSTAHVFSILLEPTATPVGSVVYWEKTWRDETIFEMGWGVLPEYQGRGIAARAAAAVVSKARAERKHRFLHAFPGVANAPSNAICRKLGFELVEECEFEYPPGHRMRCNDWRIDLFDEARA